MEEIKQNEIVADEIKASATSEENDDYIIEVDNVSMEFFTRDEKIDNLKELIIRLIKGKAQRKATKVLHDVSFKVKRGESIGLIGHNGAGKSTLLKLIAEIYKPTKGTVKVNGKVAPLLNLGAGFDYESSGKENVYLNGAILGYSRKEIAKKYEEIVEFAELKDYMHIPLKNYSSGMVARLGFAIAIDVQPDILLVDEILSVGDENFRRKCAQKVNELRERGVTFVIVSHNMQQVKSLCQKAIWIENSEVMAYGEVNEVCDKYQKYCNEKK
ncbi:MAG: ABC transporter ATP-binding protein [Clostridia bacterium]|nr:ABC transporter ATP-binding protein [Clostridia bacterium]